ncbi:folylpolyglutamate synthase/dihydrofolate synthase family protein [Sporosarcina sp. YIM B06819]|uniref:bifunctional folylpolyglutamate synthase/dihydrofolate synthase n=1 Tax=Sporosarcina sp. YIM B06819 TaxID=3081769 RepID=UPI00298D22BF|nr:folylpolyglutamate synthase/dihydrofolate synthase family protein [Sporosarcina sp. YIM B06819]
MIPKMDEYKKRWEIDSDDAVKPGLKAIQQALVKMGNPEKGLPIIHVAGSNGKGSTIAFMEGILRQHGLSTAVFSSPALLDIHDQIRLNGQPILQEDLDNAFKLMKEAGLSGMLTDFELLTVAALVSFRQFAPDYVLLETGMGGKLDSTNVVTPLVSVITSIALDHTAFLGETLEEVTEHKAGIIKSGIPVVLGSIPEEASAVAQRVAAANNSERFTYDEHFTIDCQDVFKGRSTFQLKGRKMKGPHQGINAAVAIEGLLVAGVELKEEQVATAVATTQLSFRFQEISAGVFVDGAHNPAAAKMLKETIQEEFPGEKVDFVIGMLKGKDIVKTLDELIPVAASFTFVTFPHPLAETADRLMEYCNSGEKKMTNYSNDTILLLRDVKIRKVVTGSLYMITGLMNYCGKLAN